MNPVHLGLCPSQLKTPEFGARVLTVSPLPPSLHLPLGILDSGYESLYRKPQRRIKVILGDPPIAVCGLLSSSRASFAYYPIRALHGCGVEPSRNWVGQLDKFVSSTAYRGDVQSSPCSDYSCCAQRFVQQTAQL